MRVETSDALTKVIIEKLETALKYKANEYNTNGPVNVALFFRDYIIPVKKTFSSRALEDLYDLALATIKLLKRDIATIRHSRTSTWASSKRSGKQNKQWHTQKYQKMIEDLQNFRAETKPQTSSSPKRKK